MNPAAPAGLADRIRAALEKSGGAQDAEPLVPVIVGRIGGDAPVEPSARARAARRIFPQRASALAIAATLLIIAGVVIVSIVAPPIGTDLRAQRTADAVRFIAENHGNCSHDEAYLAEEARYRDPYEAQDKLSAHLGCPITIFDLTGLPDGYEFLGGGECGVPGGENSCHLIYRRAESTRDDPNRESPYIASVFIEPDTGQFDISQRLLEHAIKACGPGDSHKAACFRDGTLVYFVICCDMGDLDAVTEAVKREIRLTAP